MPKTATTFALVREDVFAVAKMLQEHEATIRFTFEQEKYLAQEARRISNDLFNLIDLVVTDPS